MITLRKSENRGVTTLDWLDSRHAFSFGPTAPSDIRGPGVLRVINEDRIAPGRGFPEHPHKDMEIISYLLSGTLAHKDTLGNVTNVQDGEVQRMTAGTGIRHSEYNPGQETANHFLQIWIVPEEMGLTPGYEQRAFPRAEKINAWQLIAAPDGRNGSLTVHQKSVLLSSIVTTGTRLSRNLAGDRDAWGQVASGRVSLNGIDLKAGDGVHLRAEPRIEVTGLAAESEILVFEIPPAEMRQP